MGRRPPGVKRLAGGEAAEVAVAVLVIRSCRIWLPSCSHPPRRTFYAWRASCPQNVTHSVALVPLDRLLTAACFTLGGCRFVHRPQNVTHSVALVPLDRSLTAACFTLGGCRFVHKSSYLARPTCPCAFRVRIAIAYTMVRSQEKNWLFISYRVTSTKKYFDIKPGAPRESMRR